VDSRSFPRGQNISYHKGGSGSRHSLIEQILALALEHIGMDVAVLAEFSDGDEVFRVIEGDAESFDLRPGVAIPFQDSYSRRLLETRPRGLAPDARSDHRLRDLLSDQLPVVGAYIGVPVSLPDGRVYGSLFSLSRTPHPLLDERDVKFLGVLAQLVGEELERWEAEVVEEGMRLNRIRRLLDGGNGFRVAFQPIFDLRNRSVVGYEALSRFTGGPSRAPNEWFAEAADLGLGVELEIAAVQAALTCFDDMPDHAYLSVNVSPEAMTSSSFFKAITGKAEDRLVVEVTEHARVESYAELAETVLALRGRGVRLAIDDVGAGFASLRHVLRLRPDIIKLDITLTRSIDTDPVRRALASSFIRFADDIHATIAAEGIETGGELEELCTLGVGCGQGFFLAEPGSLQELSLQGLGAAPALRSDRFVATGTG
jgi:EAL domain-containing protein (putative c-di-GMP-specific phosphodiesterase class I)